MLIRCSEPKGLVVMNVVFHVYLSGIQVCAQLRVDEILQSP